MLGIKAKEPEFKTLKTIFHSRPPDKILMSESSYLKIEQNAAENV